MNQVVLDDLVKGFEGLFCAVKHLNNQPMALYGLTTASNYFNLLKDSAPKLYDEMIPCYDAVHKIYSRMYHSKLPITLDQDDEDFGWTSTNARRV